MWAFTIRPQRGLQSLCLSGDHSSPSTPLLFCPLSGVGRESECHHMSLTIFYGPDSIPRLSSWPESFVPSEGTPCPFSTSGRCLRNSPFSCVGEFSELSCFFVNIPSFWAWSLLIYFIKKTLVSLPWSTYIPESKLSLGLLRWHSGKVNPLPMQETQ